VLSIAAAFAVRLLLVLLFLPFSALDKVLNFGAAVDQAAEIALPRQAAAALIVVGFCIEVAMSLAVLTGVADRLAALVLAAYCMATAVLWKRFWAQSDFRLRGVSHGRDLFWDFLKNLAVAAGFLLIALGPTARDAGRIWAHPFSSTRPYAIEPAGT
jgi:putative oxidoreductase